MPSRILSDREVEQLASWPEEVARSDLAAFFTLARRSTTSAGVAVRSVGMNPTNGSAHS